MSDKINLSSFLEVSGPAPQGLMKLFIADAPEYKKAFVKFGVPEKWKPALIFGGYPIPNDDCHCIQHAISLEQFPFASYKSKDAVQLQDAIRSDLFGWLDKVPKLRRMSWGSSIGEGAWLWNEEYEVGDFRGNLTCWIVPRPDAGKAVLIVQLMESEVKS